MTSLTDFPPDVQALAKQAWFDHLSLPIGPVEGIAVVCQVIMADRAIRPVASGLTTRQAECLRAIQAHQAAHGVSPSVRNLMAALSLASSSGVVRLLEGLEDRGAIKRLPNRSRAITIIANPA